MNVMHTCYPLSHAQLMYTCILHSTNRVVTNWIHDLGAVCACTLECNLLSTFAQNVHKSYAQIRTRYAHGFTSSFSHNWCGAVVDDDDDVARVDDVAEIC